MRNIKLESMLFLFAVLIALGLRFYNLGAAPLTDTEAELALQALRIANSGGDSSTLQMAPQPAYIFLTSILFSLFGASNFLARFWPALAGLLLVMLPLSLRMSRDTPFIGRYAALVMAFGIALDPGLTTISRVAGGPAMAIGFGLTSIGFWFGGVPILAGILGGLALLSGPDVYAGLISMGLTWLVTRIALSKSKQAFSTQDRDNRLMVAAGAIIFLSVGTLLFQYPQGIAAWFESLLVYLNGWRAVAGVPAAELAAALIFYEGFVLIFALVGIVRWLVRSGTGEREGVFSGGITIVWALICLALAFLYPSRQVSDLGWVLVPLWVLASLEISEYLPRVNPHPVSWIQAGLVLLFSGLFWMTLIATQQIVPVEGVSWTIVRMAILAGVIALGILTTALVALGWSWHISRDGAMWGLFVACGIYSMMVMWSSTQLRTNYPQELFSSSPAIQQVDLFERTLQDLSIVETGFVEQIEIVSIVDSPSMRWLLRDYENAKFLSEPPAGELPDVVITMSNEDSSQSVEFPALNAAYRGQDFAWWLFPGWDGVLPPDIIRWIAFREAPLIHQHIILWARSDIFSGTILEPATLFEEEVNFEEVDEFKELD